MSVEKPSSKPLAASEAELKRNLKRLVTSFLEDVVNEESGRVGLPEEGEAEEVSQVREAARELVKQLLQQKEEDRADALNKIRKDIETYREHYDPDDDRIPSIYHGMSSNEFQGLLRMLPEDVTILEEAGNILGMPLEEAREKLESGE